MSDKGTCALCFRDDCKGYDCMGPVVPPADASSEIDAMNIYKAGGVMDCIRHSEGCSIWRGGPGGCTCGAIEAGRVVRRLESLARLAVEAHLGGGDASRHSNGDTK